eukprot:c46636_g1_i1.p1 GENE.c46636_g1_i1~~c46636_g1_i1.p1  ORF type:complete len:317 (-),score=58.82 c46636_g1_i1:17-967(-)
MGIQVDREDPRNHHPSYEPINTTYLATMAVILDHLCKENKDVVIPHAVVVASGGFATPWAYEWATVVDYLDRLREWIVCGPESYIGAFCLLKRLEQIDAIPPITQRTVHRIFLTCLVLAVKYIEDETLSNKDFAKVGCVTVAELNRMECDALIALGFDATVLPSEYLVCKQTLKRIEGQIAKKKPLIPKTTSYPLTVATVIELPVAESLTKRFSNRFRKSLRSRSSLPDPPLEQQASEHSPPVDTAPRRAKSMMCEEDGTKGSKPQTVDESKLERLKGILLKDYRSSKSLYSSITSKRHHSRGSNPVFLVRQDSLG